VLLCWLASCAETSSRGSVACRASTCIVHKRPGNTGCVCVGGKHLERPNNKTLHTACSLP
jgi:hypothetical protein